MRSWSPPCFVLFTLFAAAVSHAQIDSLLEYSPEQALEADSYSVEVSADLLAAAPARLVFELPFGEEIDVRRTFLDWRDAGNLQWTGGNEEGVLVNLTLVEGQVVGHVHTSKDVFQIRPSGGGRHVLRRQAARPDHTKEACGTASRPRELVAGPIARMRVNAQDDQGQMNRSSKDRVDQIRVLVVYTPEARRAAGGKPGIAALSQSVVDTSNTAFRNSRMPARFQLAASHEVAYAETGLLNDSLDWMIEARRIRELRNQTRADLVGLLVSGGSDACGIATTVPTGDIASFSEELFQVTSLECDAGLVFIHEMGHLMGMDHDPENGSPPSFNSYPWSYGHTVEGKLTTVMSYGTECQSDCPWLPYFSSPEIQFRGSATGIANRRDNRRTGNLIAPIVANFRRGGDGGGGEDGGGGTRPAAPSQLRQSSVSPSSVTLAWRDASGNEARFEIERAGDGDFRSVARLPANSTSWTDNSVTPDTTYRYRVRAGNDAGVSDFSNVVTVRTSAGDTGKCVPSSTVACVVGDRFELTVSWRDFQGETGVGRTVPVRSGQSALFWFFGADNWEMLVKMVDGCAVNQHYWLFSAATTNVAYTLRVRDTLTGAVQTYSNPLGTAAAAVTETEAFAGCR